jgi:hypothetical protein
MTVVASAHELKGLQTRLSKARADSQILKTESDAAQRRYFESLKDIKAFETRIAELTTKQENPIVTEHALLRFIERVQGVNLESIRQQILDESTIKLIHFMGQW